MLVYIFSLNLFKVLGLGFLNPKPCHVLIAYEYWSYVNLQELPAFVILGVHRVWDFVGDLRLVFSDLGFAGFCARFRVAL